MEEITPPPPTICPHDISHGSPVPLGSEDMSVRSSPYPPYHTITRDTTEEPPKKKRKSWGQVLPKPTTNLPPRKRAKTEVSYNLNLIYHQSLHHH